MQLKKRPKNQGTKLTKNIEPSPSSAFLAPGRDFLYKQFLKTVKKVPDFNNYKPDVNAVKPKARIHRISPSNLLPYDSPQPFTNDLSQPPIICDKFKNNIKPSLRGVKNQVTPKVEY